MFFKRLLKVASYAVDYNSIIKSGVYQIETCFLSYRHLKVIPCNVMQIITTLTSDWACLIPQLLHQLMYKAEVLKNAGNGFKYCRHWHSVATKPIKLRLNL